MRVAHVAHGLRVLVDRLGVRRRAKLAVSRIDINPNLLRRLALLRHAHHVTRDIDADPSEKGVVFEDDGTVGFNRIDVAIRVALVPHAPATAVAGEVDQYSRLATANWYAVRSKFAGAIWREGLRSECSQARPEPRGAAIEVSRNGPRWAWERRTGFAAQVPRRAGLTSSHHLRIIQASSGKPPVTFSPGWRYS